MNQTLNSDREELDRFKRTVKLVDFAVSYGWTVDDEESNQRVTTLRRGDGKLLVMRGDRGYDVFWDCRTDQKGSVVDFTQQQEGCRLGAARLVLRRWIGVAPPRNVERPESRPTRSESHSEEPDRKRIAAVWKSASWTPEPDYLRHRGLDLALRDARFADCYRTSRNGIVMFIHRDRSGPSGYELRGIGANGERLKKFSKDGRRALWWARNINAADTIVICESAIDCMSHAELYPELNAAYISIAGEISTKQKDLLSGLFNKSDSRNARVIIATDNDDAGEKHYSICRKLTTIELIRMVPKGKDFNDDLMDRKTLFSI